MNWLFSWMKLLDKLAFRYRHWGYLGHPDDPYPLDEAFKLNYKVREVNDKRLVYDISFHWIESIAGVAIAVFGVIFLLLLFSYLVHNIYQVFDFNFLNAFDSSPRKQPLGVKIFLTVTVTLFYFMFFPVTAIGILYPFFRPKERLVIFDRENQTVTIPPRQWGKSVTVNYKDFKVCTEQDYGAAMGQMRLFAYRPDDGQAVRIGTNDAGKERALFCEYMRKDLPLPAGELLDPYRDKDEERRILEEAKLPHNYTLEDLASIPGLTVN